MSTRYADLLHVVKGLVATTTNIKRGSHLATLTVDLIDVDVTYNVEGGNYPETEYEPAERPFPVLVTAELAGVDITAWADRLDLHALLDDYHAGYES